MPPKSSAEVACAAPVPDPAAPESFFSGGAHATAPAVSSAANEAAKTFDTIRLGIGCGMPNLPTSYRDGAVNESIQPR